MIISEPILTSAVGVHDDDWSSSPVIPIIKSHYKSPAELLLGAYFQLQIQSAKSLV